MTGSDLRIALTKAVLEYEKASRQHYNAIRLHGEASRAGKTATEQWKAAWKGVDELIDLVGIREDR